MASDVLIAQYPKQACVRDRNYSSLLRWAAYVSAQEIPSTKPPVSDVRLRIVADRMPGQIDSYVTRTLPYFMQDPGVLGRLNDCLNAFNTDEIEADLSTLNGTTIGYFMPRFALTDVTDDQVNAWYIENGYGA